MITREDLSVGYQATQAIHAGVDFIFKFPFLSYLWHKRSNYLALLSVPNEPALLQLIKKLEAKNIRHSVFREPDINNQITAIAIEPSDKAQKICSSLPLALKNISKGINKLTYKLKPSLT